MYRAGVVLHPQVELKRERQREEERERWIGCR